MHFRSALVFIELNLVRYVILEGCGRNYTDRIVPDKALALLKSKGAFPLRTCPLLSKPNDTLPEQYLRYLVGNKLSRGACVSEQYEKEKVPGGIGGTENNESVETEVIKRGGLLLDREEVKVFILPYATIYTTINDKQVREINDKKNTITLDISLTMMWMDIGIFTIKLDYGEENQRLANQTEIEIPPAKASAIWKPELPIYHLYDYKAFIDSLHMVSLKILRTNHLDNKLCMDGPMLRYQIEAKATFYCEFDFSAYPMDHSNCKFRFGGQRSNLKFTLHDPKNTAHKVQKSHASNFNILVSTAEDEHVTATENSIGLDISVQRVLQPFILKYYIPCIIIVLVSQCSFIIPLDALPGRVALVVTQLLTLTSLFIHQMVGNVYIYIYIYIYIL